MLKVAFLKKEYSKKYPCNNARKIKVAKYLKSLGLLLFLSLLEEEMTLQVPIKSSWKFICY